MLNEKNERMLAYVESITDILPIDGADRIEIALVNAWRVIVKKGELHPGDLCVFFEIDSKLPVAEWSDFMAAKGYKVKTMKLGKFNVISQGLVLPISIFTNLGINIPTELHADCTKLLNVTYATAADNERKSVGLSDFDRFKQRNASRLKKFPWKNLMRSECGRKLLMALFGKSAKKSAWPDWVSKTDEERVQNMPWILENKEPWIVTEKIDGTSATFTYKRKGKRKGYYVCSRNVVFTPKKQDCFYKENVYLAISERYNIREILQDIADELNLDWITLQGEIYGNKIQKRDYGMDDIDFMGFNLIFSNCGRMNSIEAAKFMDAYGIDWVPIVDEGYTLPDTVDELLNDATGPSRIDNELREGWVLRSPDGSRSFKAVSTEFLIKYHND